MGYVTCDGGWNVCGSVSQGPCVADDSCVDTGWRVEWAALPWRLLFVVVPILFLASQQGPMKKKVILITDFLW